MPVTAGAYPRRKHLKGPPIGFALALPSNSKTRLERVSKDKPPSLLGLVISDEGNLVCFVLGKLFQSSLMFVGKARSLPWKGTSLR